MEDEVQVYLVFSVMFDLESPQGPQEADHALLTRDFITWHGGESRARYAEKITFIMIKRSCRALRSRIEIYAELLNIYARS